MHFVVIADDVLKLTKNRSNMCLPCMEGKQYQKCNSTTTQLLQMYPNPLSIVYILLQYHTIYNEAHTHAQNYS